MIKKYICITDELKNFKNGDIIVRENNSDYYSPKNETKPYIHFGLVEENSFFKPITFDFNTIEPIENLLHNLVRSLKHDALTKDRQKELKEDLFYIIGNLKEIYDNLDIE